MSSSNPLLQGLKLPGRNFTLPSRGLFYKNGELSDDVKDGEIHVLPMSALDEINMKNPDQLFSGEAINIVLRNCIPSILKPTELLSKDVDAIILFLRSVTYGSGYEFYARHNCEKGVQHSHLADIDTVIRDIKLVDPTMIDSLYTLKLQNGQIVKLKPNKYCQTLELIRENENKTEITVEQQKKNLIMLVMGVVESVDGITDGNLILEWVEKLPSSMVNAISDKIDGIGEWGPSLIWTCTCPDCGEPFKIEIPVNPVSFFTE